MEILVTSQSAAGADDGAMTVWFDGSEIDYTNVTNPGITVESKTQIAWYGSGSSTVLFSGVQAFLYWGGGSETKGASDNIQLGELYITGSPG